MSSLKMSENNMGYSVNAEVEKLAQAVEATFGQDPDLVLEKLKQLEAIAENGDRFAHYVLASYYIFGRYPQTFGFHSLYSKEELKPYCQLDTLKGFGHYIHAITAPDNIFQDFQIDALYEMYMLISGSSNLFTTFKLIDSPQFDEAHPLSNLFNQKNTLLMMLFELKHSEIYLDVAYHLMDQIQQSGSVEHSEQIIEALNLAIECSVCWELRRDAIYKLAEIYYFGQFGTPVDIQQAKQLWGRIDDDRALSKVVNRLWKEGNIEDAKGLISGLKDPRSITPLFSDNQEVIEYIENLPTIDDLLDQAFSYELKFPQTEDTIDVGRFYEDLSLEQILAEDDQEQPRDDSEQSSNGHEQNPTDQIKDQLQDDSQDDQGGEAHVDSDASNTKKEVTEEEINHIEASQNEIAEGFPLFNEDDSNDTSPMDSPDTDVYNDDEDQLDDPDIQDDFADDALYPD